ncbi:ParB/Srx family N-terminal domain-containing protein [Delftia acidovorans]|uniref:ParB/Srx family N-terminal domain-containing protein n=1 Tax=Delftia acidovorans TaxID=80866 RepID=UPI002847DDEB|nr:ParB/Srx family N-terminal domain-containing protein [Delftia acidovorans]
MPGVAVRSAYRSQAPSTSSTAGIRKMRGTGVVKRADGVQASYESIHIEPGFNLRQDGAELEESIDALTEHIMGGGRYPPLEVRVREDGGLRVVDGHRRHAAIGRAISRGAPLRNPADRKAWMTAQYIRHKAGKKVKPVR